MKITSEISLKIVREEYKKALDAQEKKVMVCAGTGCVAGGSLAIYDKLKALIEEKGLKVAISLEEETDSNAIGVKKTGCFGLCEKGPLVKIFPQDCSYLKVSEDDCEEIIEKSVIGNEVIDRLIYMDGETPCPKQEDIPFYKKQTRIALENCGFADATSIEEYIARGGYSATAKALFEMQPSDILNEITESNLRGRGGGGFKAGIKWNQVARQDQEVKYVVCNGDEGDPGAFMDGSVMEGDPHKMIEGMIIAGIATGSQYGYIYVRAEYPLAVERLTLAIEQAKEKGLLGDNILGSDFSFDLRISQGAGAFVCGEGSALTASIEGNRGMPRVKPPRTVEKGLFEKPTVLNNVETFANVPAIILNGAAWYKGIGPEKSPGTKAFALTGNIANTGLIEVPMGTTLKEVIFDIGGGIKDDAKFKAVQIGGPSGGCLTEEHFDLPLDFDSLKKVGAMIGSGGLVVMNDKTCMVEVARFFMQFTQNESCGKCTPCREGTKRMFDVLEKIVAGEGTLADLDMLEELGEMISATALCGLGKTAASPVLSTLKYFKDEYLAHVVDKKCPAGECGALKRVVIDRDKCVGCSKCARHCPVNAISGEIKHPYSIDHNICIKCGVCIESCNFGAISEEW